MCDVSFQDSQLQSKLCKENHPEQEILTIKELESLLNWLGFVLHCESITTRGRACLPGFYDCLVVFLALTLKLPIQTSLSVASKLQVCVRACEKCQKCRKTVVPQSAQYISIC